eukprot:m.224341 g.224341  ORF g.224341 m.224341 type:complete len:372 (+) comp25876_c0_seq6:1037-2152(+)
MTIVSRKIDPHIPPAHARTHAHITTKPPFAHHTPSMASVESEDTVPPPQLSRSIPPILLGTMEWPEAQAHPPTAMVDAVTRALAAGFVGVDCAELYTSTPHTAAGLANAKAKAPTFICTKLRGLATADLDDAQADYAAVKARIVAHLADLNVASVNLLLMHWPGPSECDLGGDPAAVAAASTWEYFDSAVDSAWANMVRLRSEGLCHSIGISNFYKPAFDRLIAGIPDGASLEDRPVANQLFVDPTHPEWDYVAELQAANVTVLGFRPLAFCPNIEMAGQMGDGTWGKLAAAAEEAGAASVQQFALGWMIKRGIVPVVKTLTHAESNVAATALPDHHHYHATDALFGPSEMVDMCGGADEYASIFRHLAPP